MRAIQLEPIPHPAAKEPHWATGAQQSWNDLTASTAPTFGDGVAAFDEMKAARGFLGRFPGSEVMTLIQRFSGRSPVHF